MFVEIKRRAGESILVNPLAVCYLRKDANGVRIVFGGGVEHRVDGDLASVAALLERPIHDRDRAVFVVPEDGPDAGEDLTREALQLGLDGTDARQAITQDELTDEELAGVVARAEEPAPAKDKPPRPPKPAKA